MSPFERIILCTFNRYYVHSSLIVTWILYNFILEVYN